jgi:hypothetical protein
MRLVGIRAGSATLGLGLLAAMLGIVGAGSSGPASTRYEVTAELLLASDGRVFACYAYLQSFPTDGCGGIEVLGVTFSQISGMEGYPNGGQGSPPVRLVGTWDGQALSLTEPPQSAEKAPGLPEPCRQELGFDGAPGMRLQQQLGDDLLTLRARQIDVLETMPCDDTTLGIVVVVADRDTGNWLTSHYRPIKVVGWLRPLPSGP